MPFRAFETVQKNLETFFGGASVTITRKEEVDADADTDVIARKIPTEHGDYHLVLRRSGFPFTETERVIVDEIAEAFQIFFITRRRCGDIAYFRMAILSSLMDVAISRHLRFGRHRTFWPIQRLIRLLQSLSYQTYEGKPATSGFVVYRSGFDEFRVACSKSECLCHDFTPRIRISANYFRNPLTYRLVNGLGTYYACNSSMQATGLLKFMNYWNRSSVERLSHRDTKSLIKQAGDGTFAVYITSPSELEVMIYPDKIFVWRKGNWSLFDPDIYRNFLSGHLEAKELESLILTVYSLSKLRLGTIVLIADEDTLGSADLKKGAVGGKDTLSQLIISIHRNKTISGLNHSGELISLLSSDGMTLFNRNGELLDTGIIINTCATRDVVTGGGRTTAATVASFFGKVIKVSEDGPIELYEGGRCVYRFG